MSLQGHITIIITTYSYGSYRCTSIGITICCATITNDVQRRIGEHGSGTGSAFTVRYHVGDLLYYEEYGEVRQAISREKQLKAWSRKKKMDLIRRLNPDLVDLADGFWPE